MNNPEKPNLTPPKAVEKKLLNARDFQHEYGPCRTQLWKLINQGDIKAKKVGAKLYIDRKDAEIWRANLPAAD